MSHVAAEQFGWGIFIFVIKHLIDVNYAAHRLGDTFDEFVDVTQKLHRQRP